MQSKDRTYQVIAIVALVIGVCALTVGFAAFTQNLTINSSATVRPASSDLNVEFSRSNTAGNYGTITATNVNNATSGSATLSNLTVSGIQANFTEPGEKVTYTFYVYNDSAFVAYLTNIAFNTVGETGNFKSCTPYSGNPANPATIYEDACADITFALTVESQTNVNQISTGKTGAQIADSTGIPAHSGKQVTVEVEYPAGSDTADGDFNIAYGDIVLSYSSVPAVSGS